MRAEILFPEVCNLYGDLANIRYLKACCPELEVMETDLKSRPRFLDEEIDLVYMGSTTEKGLGLAANALRAVKDELTAKLDAGQLMLVTGNAPDILGEYMESDEGWRVEGVGILPCYTTYQMMNRHNSFYLGKMGEMDIVGFKSLFGLNHGAPEEDALFITARGIGRDKSTTLEGWRRNNLLATSLIGPLLVLNPPLAAYILKCMGAENPALAFEDAAMDSYRKRVEEFAQENRPWLYV